MRKVWVLLIESEAGNEVKVYSSKKKIYKEFNRLLELEGIPSDVIEEKSFYTSDIGATITRQLLL